MRYFAMCRRSNSLKADQRTNLFCAGEKAGLLVGHTEAIVTGVLAGHNMYNSSPAAPSLSSPGNWPWARPLHGLRNKWKRRKA